MGFAMNRQRLVENKLDECVTRGMQKLNANTSPSVEWLCRIALTSLCIGAPRLN